MQRVGRNIYKGKPVASKYNMKLSIFRRIARFYYEIRLKLVDRRLSKLGGSITGYKADKFNAFVYLKQYYLYRIEAIYSKQELRDYMKRTKDIWTN